MSLTIIVLMLACAPTFAEDPVATSGAESAIKEHFKDFDQTWAKHDAKAVAAFYTEKAEIVTESGQTFSGRDGIEQCLTEAFDNNLKDSILTITVQKIRLIKPDVALVDSDAQIKQGDADPNTLHLVSILVKQDGKWMTETSRAIAYKERS
jgi:uncharacterized protein (TIGR02246 family)